MKTFEKKTWLIPSTAPEIQQYKEYIPLFIEKQGLSFTIPPDVVDEGHVLMGQQLVCVLEHYPKAIESVLFSMDFQFEQIADSNLYFHELDWKGNKKYFRWFYKLGDVFVMPFFIRDPDARFYCMAGNLMAEGKVKITGFDKPRQKLSFEGEGLTLLMNRMWETCVLMMVFCTGAPFDVVQYIDIFISEYNPTFTLEQVITEYERRMEAGFEYRVKANK